MRKASKRVIKKEAKASVPIAESMPLSSTASFEVRTGQRRNYSTVIERTDRYKNIDDGLVPFKVNTGYGSGASTVDIKDAIILCQKAYYNFSQFRNVIDMMTEFSVSKIYFRGGNAKAKKFFDALLNKLNILSFQIAA